jgi:ParB-like chromosome segregation protein Spo0J
MDVQNVPLDSIVIPDSYILTLHRKNTCEAIRVTGLMMPVVVRREDGRYILVDGYERIQCAKEFGWREVPAIITDDTRVDVLRLALNYVRGRVCGIDVLMYVWQLSQQYDAGILAKILGREYDTIRKYRSAAEALIALGLSKEEYQELHQNCVSLRKLISCAFDSKDKRQFFECLTYKPSGKRVTIELIKKAAELERDPDMRTAVDMVDMLGKDRIMRLAEIWDLAKKTICTRLDRYKKKLLPEDYRLLEMLCQ